MGDIVIRTDKFSCVICRMNGKVSKMFVVIEEKRRTVRICEEGHRIETLESRTMILSKQRST